MAEDEYPEVSDPCFDPGPQTHIARIVRTGLPDLELPYAEVDGFAVVEGHIIVGRVDETNERTGITEANAPTGVGVTGWHYRWPNRVVPYEISAALPNPKRVTDAIAHFDAQTVLSFPQRTPSTAWKYPNYVIFVSGAESSSYAGMQGGQQRITLTDDAPFGHVLHELAHAVGLWHEHNREDRDNYIRLDYCNIEAGRHGQFYRHISEGDDIGPYDFGSVTHYWWNAFAKDRSRATIISKVAGVSFGNWGALSRGDIETIRVLYSTTGGGPVRKLLLPSAWSGESTSWARGFSFLNVFGFGFASGAGAGAFTYSFGLPEFELQGREASVTATLTSGAQSVQSDVTLVVNGTPHATYRVQAYQQGAGGSRYQWVLPEDAFLPGAVNTVELKVDAGAQLPNGLSIFQTEGDAQSFIEVAIPHEPDETLLDYDAAFVSQSVPTFMAPGSRHDAIVTMRNIGTVPWRPGRIRLGSQEPADNTRWGTQRVDLPAGIDVAPNTETTFAFPVTAPVEQGRHSFRWKVLREGVSWFGQSNRPLTITVAADSLPVRQQVPAGIVAGTAATVSITMRNISQVTWTRGTYRLASQNPAHNATWGTSRADLPSDVAPGAEAVFTFRITAPQTVGHHNMQWQLFADGRGWLGLPTDNVVVRVMPPLTQQSVFVSQSVPSPMLPGSTQRVTVTMRNVGTATWTAAEGYRLGSQNPMDNTRWGLHRVDLPHDVPPNAEVAFTFTVRTHSTEGFMNFQWQMLQEGVGWFGQMTDNVEVRIAHPLRGALFVRQSVPSSMTLGSPPNASITMRNTGEETWRPGGNYRLGSQNPMNNGTWGTNRVSVPHDVPPNTEVTFVFPMAATTTGAEKNFQWRMALDGVAWFGQWTPNVVVRVR